jgi:hypothetical protein
MADLLELSVSKSTDIIHLGDEFLLYIKVRNPLNSPIDGISITYDVPTGFVIKKISKALVPFGSSDQPSSLGSILLQRIKNFFIPSHSEETVFDNKKIMSWPAVQILASETYTITMPIRIGGHFLDKVKADTYHLAFEVRYGLGTPKVEHNQQVKTDIIVYPHSGYIFMGGIIGGIVGAIIRNPSSLFLSSLLLVLDIIIGVLTGIVMVLIFRRKSNVQSFISVEDFWGGFLIGIVGGYAGQEILSKYIGT